MKTYFFVFFACTFFVSHIVATQSPPVEAIKLPIFRGGTFVTKQTYALNQVIRVRDLDWQIRYWAGLFLGTKVFSACASAVLAALSTVCFGGAKASGKFKVDGVKHVLWHASAGIGAKTVTLFFVVINNVAHMIALGQHATPTSYRILYEQPGNSIVNAGQHNFVLP